jgi:hypothetical protein
MLQPRARMTKPTISKNLIVTIYQINILVVIGTGLTAFFTYLAAPATRDSATQAKISAEAAQKTLEVAERQWLRVVSTEVQIKRGNHPPFFLERQNYCALPAYRYCNSKERELIIAELSEVITDRISRPFMWPSGLLSFVVTSTDFSNRAPAAARYCDQVEGNKPGSGRLFLFPGGFFSPVDADAAFLRSLMLHAAVQVRLRVRPARH